MRVDRRGNDELRPIKLTTDYLIHPEGSVLVEFGNTKVICTATIEPDVPPFLKQSASGWVTAEYSMLPRATSTRTKRERQKLSGRTSEIQRFIGRSLRSIVDLKAFPECQIVIDCDVIQADGGTRTASLTGGFVAMVEAFKKMKKAGDLVREPIRDYVAAVSLGKVQGVLRLDLDYSEDSMAEVDMNLVMTSRKQLVEIQGTAEKTPFPPEVLHEMLEFGWRGIEHLIAIQREAIGSLE
ncbi:MAG: ribonuclease PH [Deltaproteobacteria bacterium]